MRDNCMLMIHHLLHVLHSMVLLYQQTMTIDYVRHSITYNLFSWRHTFIHQMLKRYEGCVERSGISCAHYMHLTFTMWTLINKHPPIPIYLLGTLGTFLLRSKGWRWIDRTIIPTIKRDVVSLYANRWTRNNKERSGILTQQYPSPKAWIFVAFHYQETLLVQLSLWDRKRSCLRVTFIILATLY